MHQIPASLQHVAPLVNHYGYAGVFGLLFAEDFGVPVPGETMLIAASVFAGLGQLNIWLVVACAIVAAVSGDSLGYLIGKYLGKEPLHRYGKYVLLTPEKLRKATGFFDKYGGRVVIVARFIEGLRQLNGILAGVSGMKWRSFIGFNLIGASLWVGTWSAVGYFGGDHIDVIERYGSLLAIAALAAAVAWLGTRWYRGRAKAKAGH